MKVSLIHHTPLYIADFAIGKCWDKTTEDPEERMYRVANKNKHASTIEHVSYNFNIEGISRACLQELARHRMQSLSVKSTRYTLKELQGCELDIYNYDGFVEFDKKQVERFLVLTGNPEVDGYSALALKNLQVAIQGGISNDIVKYCLPESYKTSLVSTMNMRALQNFLNLRTDKSALKEIQELAHNMFQVLPQDHKFMLVGFVKSFDGEEDDN